MDKTQTPLTDKAACDLPPGDPLGALIAALKHGRDLERSNAEIVAQASAMAQENRNLQAECERLRADIERNNDLLRLIRNNTDDCRVCCETPIVHQGSPDHPPEQECCGEPDFLHDLIDSALEREKKKSKDAK